MRFTVHMLLVTALLAQVFSKTIIYAAFEANREYIAQHLCENRNRPAMHCNGKCHLKKQMNETEKGEPQLPGWHDSNELVFQCSSMEDASFMNDLFKTLEYPDLKLVPVSSHDNEILRPPAAG